MIVKEKLTGRTMTVLPHEKKKLEILLYSGWVVVEEVSKPEPKPVLPVASEIPDVVVVAVEEQKITEPKLELVDADETPVMEGEVVEDDGDDTPEFPIPATEPRKARLHAPKVKKTLKLPDDYA